MVTLLTLDQVLARLRTAVQGAGTQAAFAVRCGVKPPYLNRVLRGLEPPSPAILDPLGLQRVVRYVSRDVGDR